MELDRARGYVALGLCVLALRASAGDDGAFSKLLGDPVEQQHVISGAKRATVVLQNPCTEAQFSIENKFVPYKPLSFDSGGNIASGAWKQIVDEQGCGTRHVLNVMVSVHGAGDLAFVPLLPGTTHADPVLQKDAVKIVVQALSTVPGGREANCAIGYFANTEFLQQEGVTLPGAKEPPWRELWTLQSCTQKMLVPVRSIPDPTGTSISVGPNADIRIVSLAY
ncbi:MAG TPA: hypothetical protein VK829_15300 [Terriglobales bacterium]|jgi:hypothetical protein|nr:hypothetical protein [Terriglobales bacterium]